jgi:hypothetical protein
LNGRADTDYLPPLEFGNRAFAGLGTDAGRVIVIDSPREVAASLVPIDPARDILVHAAYMARPVAVSLLRRGLRGFLGVDAGIGRNEAGIGGLAVAERLGVPAAAASVYSCAMCVGRSVWEEGVISRVNGPAAACGAEPGQSVARAAEFFLCAPPGRPWDIEAEWPDAPVLLAEGGPFQGKILGCWSMSLVQGENVENVFCVGTPVDTMMALYVHRHAIRPAGIIGSDGGFGRGQMAIAGAEILERMGIACAAVSHLSADLGDAASIYRDGRITRANAPARAAGIAQGMTASAAASLLLAAARSPPSR